MNKTAFLDGYMLKTSSNRSDTRAGFTPEAALTLARAVAEGAEPPRMPEMPYGREKLFTTPDPGSRLIKPSGWKGIRVSLPGHSQKVPYPGDWDTYRDMWNRAAQQHHKKTSPAPRTNPFPTFTRMIRKIPGVARAQDAGGSAMGRVGKTISNRLPAVSRAARFGTRYAPHAMLTANLYGAQRGFRDDESLEDEFQDTALGDRILSSTGPIRSGETIGAATSVLGDLVKEVGGMPAEYRGKAFMEAVRGAKERLAEPDYGWQTSLGNWMGDIYARGGGRREGERERFNEYRRNMREHLKRLDRLEN